jgi:hypothetical protein
MVKIVFWVLVFAAVSLALGGLLFMLAWNASVAVMFGATTIGFWSGLASTALLSLSGLAFGAGFKTEIKLSAGY